MKVRVLCPMAGKKSYSIGDIYECDKAEAQRMIDKGYAEPIKTTKKKAKK